MTKHDSESLGPSVLVTGGAGFIGSYLVDHLLALELRVIVVDDLRQAGLMNLRHCLDRVQLETVDICDGSALAAAFERHRPRTVFHLAALHFIPYCTSYPAETMLVNDIGTQNVAACCEKHSVSNIFYASTAAVYAPSDEPHDEESLVDPVDIYGISKLAGENCIGHMSRANGRVIRIGRYFNAVGLRETNPHIVPELLSQVQSSGTEAINLRLGNVSPRRDYIHASDLAAASVATLTRNRQMSFDIVNMGSEQAHSVADIVQLISEITGRSLKIEHDPLRFRKSDRSLLCANSHRLRLRYAYVPARNLRQSLHEVFAKYCAPDTMAV